MVIQSVVRSRACRLACSLALFISLDAAMSSDRYAAVNGAEPKGPVAEDKSKKTPDELRKELEEKLKGIPLDDPRFDEINQEYEKLIKDAIARAPQVPNGLVPLSPQDRARILELQRRNLQPFPDFEIAPRKGRLGILIETLAPAVREQLNIPDNQGQLIKEVTPDSVAEKIGLKANDIVLEFAGKPVPADTQDFIEMVLNFKADAVASITILRRGKKETIKDFKLPEVKQDLPQLGMRPIPRLVPAIDFGEGENMERTSVRMVNGEFTIQAVRAGVDYQITGTRGDENHDIKSIRIKEGDKVHTATKVDEVPEAYRKTVKALLKSIR